MVEGVGDHGCEYMTGGLVIVMGETGKNFAAGMSGGIAYVYDTKKDFKLKCNMEMVDLDPMESEDYDVVRGMIRNHFLYTGSNIALNILNTWEEHKGKFVKVMPTDYKRALQKKKAAAKEQPASV